MQEIQAPSGIYCCDCKQFIVSILWIKLPHVVSCSRECFLIFLFLTFEIPFKHFIHFFLHFWSIDFEIWNFCRELSPLNYHHQISLATCTSTEYKWFLSSLCLFHWTVWNHLFILIFYRCRRRRCLPYLVPNLYKKKCQSNSTNNNSNNTTAQCNKKI